MPQEQKHLVFYDGQCGLCDYVVQFILRNDEKKIFLFAPLQGETAKVVLKDLPDEYKQLDSLVLIENYQGQDQQFLVMGKAAFRILWLLGGRWALMGLYSFLPSYLYDWGYRFVAQNRHRFFDKDACMLPTVKSKDRFLP